MRQITKVVQEIGNGGHIYLPREMIGQKVVVTLIQKNIAEIEWEILERARSYLKHIKGIYLYGSYARNEQTPESDIDVLIVTDGRVKIKSEDYQIMAVSEEQIRKMLDYNAVLLLPILKEARAILN